MFSIVYSLAWHQNLLDGKTYLVTGHGDASVRYWQFEKIQNKFSLNLMWGTKPTQLNLKEVNLEGARGLSLLNVKLLEQRGAQGKPNMIQYLISASEQGDANAQAELGKLYREGKDAEQDLTSSIIWLTKAAEQKHPAGEFYLGECYRQGIGVPKDIIMAMKLFMAAAEDGSAEAQEIIGNCYLVGKELSQDIALGIKWLNKAAEQNNAEAQFNLAECYRLGKGVEQSYQKAFSYYSDAEKQGHALAIQALQIIPTDYSEYYLRETWYLAYHGSLDAQNNLALWYYQGEGIEKNLNKAIEWWTQSAEKGHARAQTHLGECYQRGEGVTQNWEIAVKWWVLAAAQEDLDALFNLGQCYEKGNVVSENIEKAVELYMKAQRGSLKAQTSLGCCYKDGRGVEQDRKKAMELFDDAAAHGDVGAKFQLGQCYYHGYGIMKSLIKALECYKEAAQEGYVDAQSALEVLAIPQDDVGAMRWCAEHGDVDAQMNLGCYYRQGKHWSNWWETVEKNFKSSADWYSKAAEQGHSEAQYWMGVYCAEGLGIEQNSEKAFFWFNKVIGSENDFKILAHDYLGTMCHEG